MPHHIYQTRGFIVGDANVGEADRTVFVFTEQLGLLSVYARATRKISSKLRCALSKYSFVRIALVRGKNVWRLTDAEELACFRASNDAEKLKMIAGVFSFVNRFVRGEGENVSIFQSVEHLFCFLREEELSVEEMFLTETIIICRILSALGYVGESQTLAPFLRASVPLSRSFLENFAPHRKEALKEINRAMQESHL